MALFFGKKKNKNINEVRKLLKELENSFRELSNLANISKNNYGTPAPIVGIAKSNSKVLTGAISKIDLLKLKLRYEKKLSHDLEIYLDELKEILVVNLQLLNKYFDKDVKDLNKNNPKLSILFDEIKETAEMFSKTIKKEDAYTLFNKIDKELNEIERVA